MAEQQEQPSSDDQAETSREDQDRREEGRVAVFYETEVRSLGEAHQATVRNFSRWGVMVQSSAQLSVRSYIYVVLPGVGSLPGRVTWARSGCFGANLLEPISAEHFDRLVRILPSTPADATA